MPIDIKDLRANTKYAGKQTLQYKESVHIHVHVSILTQPHKMLNRQGLQGSEYYYVNVLLPGNR